MNITTVFPEHVMKDGLDVAKESDHTIIQYDFDCCNIRIGDGGIVSAAELKACKISLLSSSEYHVLHARRKRSRKDIEESREKGIKEYEILKLSLLSYDALLVTLGSVVLAGSGHNEIAEGFCIGGMIGFLYLFLLQRAVDRIPSGVGKEDAMNSSDVFRSDESESTGNLARFRSPLIGLAASFMVLGVTSAVLFSSTNEQPFSKEMLFAGAAGFLMSKISTVLASSKPLPVSTHN